MNAHSKKGCFNKEAFTQASSLSVKSALLNERALLEEGVFDTKGQSLTEHSVEEELNERRRLD